MNFNWTEATQSVQAMASGFIARLPYFSIAVVVFIAFVLLGHAVQRGIRALFERGRKAQRAGSDTGAGGDRPRHFPYDGSEGKG